MTSVTMNRFFTMPAASHMSSLRGLSSSLPLPMRALLAQHVGVQREGVIVADGVHAADAGKDALASAAKARHDVVGGRTEADDPIRMGGLGIDAYRRAVRRVAQIDQVRGVAVVVDDANAVVNRICYQRAELLLVAAVMGAVGNDNGDDDRQLRRSAGSNNPPAGE